MKMKTLIATLPALAIAASALGQDATATYDAATGELIFDFTGAVQLVGVGSVGNFDTDATPGALTLFGGAVNSNPLQYDADTIAYFFGNDQAFDQSSFNVGPILPTGLSEGDFTFEYTPVGGQTVQSSVNVINVPEPGSIALLGLGGLALLRRRRAA